MKIEHLGIWTKDLERMREFYLKFFDLPSNKKYYNSRKNFSSYFLAFENGARLELMRSSDISERIGKPGSLYGLTHLAFSVGSKEKIDMLTERLRDNGITIIREPREQEMDIMNV